MRDDAAAMARVVIADGELVYGSLFRRTLRSRPAGRGAHLHPRPLCISRAPRGLARTLRAPVRIEPSELGRRLAAISDATMVELVLAARRAGQAAMGFEADAALIIVAVDGCSAGEPLAPVVAAGRAIAWKTKRELGALLGEQTVAICSVRDGVAASQLVELRAALLAGMAMAGATREGAECSRCPEAR